MSILSIRVRPGTPDDLDIVMEFNRYLALETEGKTLDPALLRPGVQAGLTDPVRCRYEGGGMRGAGRGRLARPSSLAPRPSFPAEEGGQILGQLAVTREWSDWRNGWFWWLQSVFVRPEARKRGVF